MKGKKGTICRAGVETDTAEVEVIKHKTVVHAVEEAFNEKGDSRLRLMRPVRGWVSLKTLVKVDGEAVIRAPTRSGASSASEWPMVNVSVEDVEMVQKWLNLFKSLDEARFQAKPLPRWFLPSPAAVQRSYFDSMGSLTPPASPPGWKAPLVAPRCGDALPASTDVLPSTPERYREASLTCEAGVPSKFEGLIAADDAVQWAWHGLLAAGRLERLAPRSDGARLGLLRLVASSCARWRRASNARRRKHSLAHPPTSPARLSRR